MNKKLSIILISFVLLFTGCSCSKKDLINENTKLIEENQKLSEDVIKYKGVEDVFEFYNKITTENVNSFVLVESKYGLQTKYSNGVVIASNGYYYYVITDYNSIKQSSSLTTYRVMDANATVYNASLPTSNVYDIGSGLILLQVNASGYTNIAMQSIEFGIVSDIVAYFSSVSQMNKIQLTEQLKTSTITYNDASYNSYYLENITMDSGTLLISENNKLCGIYLSNYNAFTDSDLIKQIMYSTYSLVL